MRRTVFVLALALVVCHEDPLSAFPGGLSGYSGNPTTKGGSTCQSCHDGGAVPAVSFTGPASVAPGETNTYMLTISGGQKLFGALDVSSTGGALSAFESGTQLLDGEITHTGPKAVDSSGSVAFSFQWTAPSSPGSVTFYGAGMSSDGDGKSGDGTDAATLVVTVESVPAPNQPPVADAGGPYSGVVGQTIQLDGSASTDSDGEIVSYSWDFGDGSTGSGVSPSHAYASPGSYTVKLVVEDDLGETDVDEATVSIGTPENQPPVADAGGPYAEAVGEPIGFDGSLSDDPDGEIVSYSWDFGDGFSDSVAQPSHAYAAAGSFVVTLTVMDDMGLTDTDQTTVEVGDGTVDMTVRIRAPRKVRLREGQTKALRVVVQSDIGSLQLDPGAQACGVVHLFANGEEVDSAPICITAEGVSMEPSAETRDAEDNLEDHDASEDQDEDEDEEDGDDEARDSDGHDDENGPEMTARETSATATTANSRNQRSSGDRQKKSGKRAAEGVLVQERVRVTFSPTVTAADAPAVEWSALVEIEGSMSDVVARTTKIVVRGGATASAKRRR